MGGVDAHENQYSCVIRTLYICACLHLVQSSRSRRPLTQDAFAVLVVVLL